MKIDRKPAQARPAREKGPRLVSASFQEEKGEVSSPLIHFPEAFDHQLNDFRRKKPEEIAQFMKGVLARDESEAIKLLKPVFQLGRGFKEVFEIYKPAIQELKKHCCRRGRPSAGSSSWKTICKREFGVSSRWVDILLQEERTRSRKPIRADDDRAAGNYHLAFRDFKSSVECAFRASDEERFAAGMKSALESLGREVIQSHPKFGGLQVTVEVRLSSPVQRREPSAQGITGSKKLAAAV